MTWRRSTTETTTSTFTSFQVILQTIKTHFDNCAAETDFPWQVASFAWDTPSAGVGYIVLKRKNGTAGRIYFGCTPSTSYYSSGYLGNHAVNVFSGITVGYDRTATADIPTQAANVGPPFGGTFRTNWMGAIFPLTTTTLGSALTFRCYTKTDIDTFIFTHALTTQLFMYGVGNCIQNQHTNQPQLGQITANGADWNQLTTTGAWERVVATATDTRSGQTISRACTWDATNGWQRLALITSATPPSVGGTVLDLLFSMPDGTRYFIPLYFIGGHGDATQTQKMFRLKNMGIGATKTRLTSELLDNTLANRGWYLAYSDTQGSDGTGFNLLNVDFT